MAAGEGAENGMAMTPSKLLIAQRLDESARELVAIVTLMDEHRSDPRWALHTAELARAADLAEWWASEIRSEA